MNWPATFPERAVHAQARIDLLKANFNPNLHLNEANPDEALYTLVDKTDLVVGSSEFCFTPMGIFEIESVGRIYRPVPLTADALAAGTNVEVLAEKKIVANLRVYDALRETTQKQFFGDNPGTAPSFSRRGSSEDSRLAPTLGAASSVITTNYGYALQTGPEPDNGDAPYDNEYEGYVGLATYGGAGSGGGLGPKQKHELRTNLPGASQSIRPPTPRYQTIVSMSQGVGGVAGSGFLAGGRKPSAQRDAVLPWPLILGVRARVQRERQQRHRGGARGRPEQAV